MACQDHILQEGLVSFAIIPGKESCMKLFWFYYRMVFLFFNLGLILKNDEFNSNVCRYLPEKGNFIAN